MNGDNNNLDFLENYSEQDLLNEYDTMFNLFCERDFDIINQYFDQLKLLNEIWHLLKRKERKRLLNLARITFVNQSYERLAQDKNDLQKYLKKDLDYNNFIKNKHK